MLEFSPTDVDVTCMHSMACKGAAYCGLICAPRRFQKVQNGQEQPTETQLIVRLLCLQVPVVVLCTVQLLLNINILKTIHMGHGNLLSLHDGTTPVQKKLHLWDPYPWEKRQFLQQGPPEALSWAST